MFLCAGRGSRMKGVNRAVPKCLMPIGSETFLSFMVSGVISLCPERIIIVGGYGMDALRSYSQVQNWKKHIELVENTEFKRDKNIYSALLGQKNANPGKGILFVETDSYLTEDAWFSINKALSQGRSFICVSEFYSRKNTGGVVKTDQEGRVTDIGYAPKYDPFFEGAHRMAGIFYISEKDVSNHSKLLEFAARKNIDQYHFAPLMGREAEFDIFAAILPKGSINAFNTVSEYKKTLSFFED